MQAEHPYMHDIIYACNEPILERTERRIEDDSWSDVTYVKYVMLSGYIHDFYRRYMIRTLRVPFPHPEEKDIAYLEPRLTAALSKAADTQGKEVIWKMAREIYPDETRFYADFPLDVWEINHVFRASKGMQIIQCHRETDQGRWYGFEFLENIDNVNRTRKKRGYEILI